MCLRKSFKPFKLFNPFKQLKRFNTHSLIGSNGLNGLNGLNNREDNRMKYILFISSLLVLALSTPAFAAQSEVDRVVKKLEKQYETMKDFHAGFEQETRLASINRVEKGSGTIWFKKPGKMLWEYAAPQVQKIILDGKNLWLYLPEDKQVMKNNFSTIPQHIVVDLFRGKIIIQEKFKVSLMQQELKNSAKEISLELVPLSYDPTVKKLTLWVDAEKFYILRTCLEDDFGTKTMLAFSHIEIDKNIPDSTFAFTPPPGVEVFEPPQAKQ
jgi:outer membrane lipoprotein carrier protein